jgi:acyl transferase domain-containing protein
MGEDSKVVVGNDIAIIGVACRFPGDAVNPSEFFNMLLAGRDAWKKTPMERFDADAFYHPHNARHGTMVVKGGYYLKEDVGAFDAPVRNTMKTLEAIADEY